MKLQLSAAALALAFALPAQAQAQIRSSCAPKSKRPDRVHWFDAVSAKRM